MRPLGVYRKPCFRWVSPIWLSSSRRKGFFKVSLDILASEESLESQLFLTKRVASASIRKSKSWFPTVMVTCGCIQGYWWMQDWEEVPGPVTLVHCHFQLTHLMCHLFTFSSVQFSRSVVSDSLRPHESQQARPPCPSPTPRVHSNSRPSNWWCHPAISSSVYLEECYLGCDNLFQCPSFWQYARCGVPCQMPHSSGSSGLEASHLVLSPLWGSSIWSSSPLC